MLLWQCVLFFTWCRNVANWRTQAPHISAWWIGTAGQTSLPPAHTSTPITPWPSPWEVRFYTYPLVLLHSYRNEKRCSVMRQNISPPTWAFPAPSCRYPKIYVFHSKSSFSSLSLSAFYRFASRSGKMKHFEDLLIFDFFFFKSLFCYQLLHVASKVEAGQGFFLLCVIFCSFLCLFLFFTSPLFLEDNNMQPTSKIVSNTNLYMLQATATHLNLKSLLTLFVSLTAYPMLLRALRAALLLKQFIALCHYWCMV